MTAWFKRHRKALAGFATTLTTEATALLAEGVLSGNIAHYVALGLMIAAPVFTFLGVKQSPANDT